MRIGLSLIAGATTSVLLWGIMFLLCIIVNLIYPVQFSMSEMPRKACDYAQWVVPVVGGIAIAAVAFGFIRGS